MALTWPPALGAHRQRAWWSTRRLPPVWPRPPRAPGAARPRDSQTNRETQVAHPRWTRPRPSALAAEIEEAFLSHPFGEMLASMPGIGPRTGARILAEIGDGSAFANGSKLSLTKNMETPPAAKAKDRLTAHAMLFYSAKPMVTPSVVVSRSFVMH